MMFAFAKMLGLHPWNDLVGATEGLAASTSLPRSGALRNVVYAFAPLLLNAHTRMDALSITDPRGM